VRFAKSVCTKKEPARPQERELPIDCTSATHQEVREYSDQRNKLELALKPMACFEVGLPKFMLQDFG
jgi:hypothetical protein